MTLHLLLLKIISVVIPKQKHMKMGVNGIGDIFVYFANSDDATRAKNLLASRTYNGNPIKVVFYPENLFKMERYALNWVESEDLGNGNSDSNSNNIEESISSNYVTIEEKNISNNHDNNDNKESIKIVEENISISIANNNRSATSMEELD